MSILFFIWITRSTDLKWSQNPDITNPWYFDFLHCFLHKLKRHSTTQSRGRNNKNNCYRIIQTTKCLLPASPQILWHCIVYHVSLSASIEFYSVYGRHGNKYQSISNNNVTFLWHWHIHCNCQKIASFFLCVYNLNIIESSWKWQKISLGCLLFASV